MNMICRAIIDLASYLGMCVHCDQQGRWYEALVAYLWKRSNGLKQEFPAGKKVVIMSWGHNEIPIHRGIPKSFQ